MKSPRYCAVVFDQLDVAYAALCQAWRWVAGGFESCRKAWRQGRRDHVGKSTPHLAEESGFARGFESNLGSEAGGWRVGKRANAHYECMCRVTHVPPTSVLHVSLDMHASPCILFLLLLLVAAACSHDVICGCVCIVFRCVALCCSVLYCVVVRCIASHCCLVLSCFVLYGLVYCIVLYDIVLYCIVSYCMLLYCIV